jgi:hypothetical protein
MQFHIQLIIACTIDQTQGLTFDHLTFDPNGIYKHVLTFTTFSILKNYNNNNNNNKPPSTFTNDFFSN